MVVHDHINVLITMMKLAVDSGIEKEQFTARPSAWTSARTKVIGCNVDRRKH